MLSISEKKRARMRHDQNENRNKNQLEKKTGNCTMKRRISVLNLTIAVIVLKGLVTGMVRFCDSGSRV